MNKTGRTPLTIAGLIASLTVLGLIIIPNFPLSVSQNPTGDQEPEVIPDISDEELDTCTSWHQSVAEAIGDKPDGQDAADLLVGAFCNRPDLIEDARSSFQPGISILAYACEATSGTLDDSAMADDLGIFGDLYCSGARDALKKEADAVRALAVDAAKDPDRSARLGGIQKTIAESEGLIESRPYLAQQGFDRAAAMLEEL
jgi:hypothetical protein